MFTKAKFISTILFVSQTGLVAFAGYTSTSRPARSPLPNSVATVAQPPCLMCDWNIVPEVAQASQGDACEDLLPAACLTANGDYKIQKFADEIEVKLKNLVKAARSKGAQQLGYKDFEDAIFKIFRKEGYPLKKDISEKAKKFLLESDYKNYVDKKEIYEVLDQCEQDKKKLDDIGIYDVKDVLRLSQISRQIEGFKNKYREISTELYMNDMPGFLNKINTQCSFYGLLKETLKIKNLLQHPIVLEFEKVCSQRKDLRAKAISYYLKQDDPAIRSEIRQFVLSFNDILYTSLSNLKTEAPTAPATAEDAKQAIYDNYNSRYDVCNSVGERFETGPKDMSTSTMQLLNTAKGTVEYLIDQIYSPEKKELVQKIHNATKREALIVAQRLTRDPIKLARIQDHFKRLGFTWFTKPTADRYIKDKKTGIEILDINKFDQMNVWTQAFSGNLEFFTTLNAFYLPDTKFGATDRPLSVTMQPLFIEMLDDYPQAFLAVMAHEVGHNIGPDVTKYNNYNLTQEYEPLLQCLSSHDSIRMQDLQIDESVADVVSAEVLAKLISQLPPEKRKASVYASMQTFCKVLDMADQDLTLSLTDSHPETILRISGIYGANPSLRKVLSCNEESKKFRSCSLTGAQ